VSNDILVVCPQAVVPAWGLQVDTWRDKNPWGHQSDAAEWAGKRKASMLALDMGTGKTLTALMITASKESPPKPVLIGKGGTKSRAAKLKQEIATSKQPKVVVVNYDSVWRGDLAKVIGSHKWKAIVLDESHRIKSPGGKASRWLASLAKANPQARLLCLTGTPMPHSPLDLYGQFRFLDPSVFGTSFARMRARYAECDPMFPSKVRKWLRQDELGSLLDRHSYRVSADEVLDLPDAIHERISVSLTPKERKFYDSLESEMVAAIGGGHVVVSNALTKLLRLQQATGGHSVVGDPESGESKSVYIDGTPSKRIAFDGWIEDLHVNEPVVVFCKFRNDINEVMAACRASGRSCSELSGWKNQLAEWQEGDTSVLVVQIQSGGVGVDLTRAAYCVYYSLGYSLGDYEQSLARLRRPGQTRCVRYYHLVAESTVDEDVYKALSARRDVVNSVLERLSCRIK
jgi:SNF2 family DNA or RNA helicase